MKSVAFLLADEKNAYQQLLVKSARDLAGKYGIEILTPQFADGMPVRQIGQFSECISSGNPPDGIVSMLVSAESMKGSIEKALKSGIACVLVNRIPAFLPRMSKAYLDVLLSSVAPDQVEIGRVQGRQCLRFLPDGGRVVLVLGDRTAPSTEERRRGFLDVVGTTVSVQELQGGWQVDRAESATSNLIRISGGKRRVDLFVCQNDPMAAGVRAALDRLAAELDAPEIGKTPIIGCDGLPDEGQRMVRERKIDATVVMPPTSPKALEMLDGYWRSGVHAAEVTLPPSSYPQIDALGPRR